VQRILLLGVDGLLGSSFMHELEKMNEYQVITTARRCPSSISFDYSPRSLLELLKETKPTLVINCIAATSQSTSLKKAFVVNSMLPIQLAIFSTWTKFQVIHFSSNAVFSGKRLQNTERTWSVPRSVYGFTKLLGDASFFRNTIIRTSFVGISPDQTVTSGLMTKLRSLEKNSQVEVRDNYSWNGITSTALVELVIGLIKKQDFSPGIFHIGTKDRISRNQLVSSLLSALGRRDVKVNVANPKFSRNFSLETGNYSRISEWWEATRYRRQPTFSDLLRELEIK
jgi:dTDP-4-dehydrorhamnose reductase